MGKDDRAAKLGLLLRVGVFAFLAYVGLEVFHRLIYWVGGLLVGAALGTFAAAAVANAVALRIYERGQLADVGMHWNEASRRHLLIGLLGGLGAACLVLAPALVAGAAELRADPGYPGSWPAILFVSVVLLFGAVGEELLFRGYGFQILVAGIGPFATILPVSVLFAALHSANEYATPLALVNTAGWGVILGVAFLRSGDLWLPIGLHFGWNWALPVFGAPVSGFRMGITGYTMHWTVADVWSGGAYGPEGGVLTSLVLIALGVYLWKAPIRAQPAFLLRAREEG